MAIENCKQHKIEKATVVIGRDNIANFQNSLVTYLLDNINIHQELHLVQYNSKTQEEETSVRLLY